MYGDFALIKEHYHQIYAHRQHLTPSPPLLLPPEHLQKHIISPRWSHFIPHPKKELKNYLFWPFPIELIICEEVEGERGVREGRKERGGRWGFGVRGRRGEKEVTWNAKILSYNSCQQASTRKQVLRRMRLMLSGSHVGRTDKITCRGLSASEIG